MTNRPVVEWMRANNIEPLPSDDAEVRVDEQAGTITVEQLYRTADGEIAFHGHRVMTHLVTVPLLVPPSPDLFAAYQHTVATLRRERNAAEAIRHETVDRIAAHITAEATRMIRDTELASNEGMRMFGYGLWTIREELTMIRVTADAADRGEGLTLGELAEFVHRAKATGALDTDRVKAKISMRGRVRELTLVPVEG